MQNKEISGRGCGHAGSGALAGPDMDLMVSVLESAIWSLSA